KAEALKLEFATGNTSPQKMEAIRTLLQEDARVWISGVELALSEFESDVLPSKIYLCGGGSLLPNVLEVLRSSEWRKKLPFAKSPRLLQLEPSDVANMQDPNGLLTSNQDVTPL